jgi:hypothetical protein
MRGPLTSRECLGRQVRGWRGGAAQVGQLRGAGVVVVGARVCSQEAIVQRLVAGGWYGTEGTQRMGGSVSHDSHKTRATRLHHALETNIHSAQRRHPNRSESFADVHRPQL